MSEINLIKLSKPSEKTWFIGWDNERNEIKAYGSCDVTQTLRSPWSEIDFYTNEEEWEQLLIDNNIIESEESEESEESNS